MRSTMRILVLCATLPLQGCFFVFIPGSLIQKTSDAMTGAEGDHCVREGTRVGDTITLTNGTSGVVRSLSGTSVRCRQTEFPIRARVEL